MEAGSAARFRRVWVASPWSGSGLGSERPAPESELGNVPGRDGPRYDLTRRNNKTHHTPSGQSEMEIKITLTDNVVLHRNSDFIINQISQPRSDHFRIFKNAHLSTQLVKCEV